MLAISDLLFSFFLQVPAEPMFDEYRLTNPDLIRTTKFYFFVGLCLLLFLVRTLFSKDWTDIIEGFRSGAIAKTKHLQDQLPFTLGWVVLLLVSSGVFAITYLGIIAPDDLQGALRNAGSSSPTYLTAIVFWTAAFFILITLRLVWLSVFTHILPVRKEVGLYVKTVAISTIFLGLALLPVALIESFGPAIPKHWLNGAILTICVVFVILRIFRGFSIAKPFLSIRIDYIIAYFCALEILPVAILLKVSGFF